ncbi:hypothetical protein [Salana multivorans]
MRAPIGYLNVRKRDEQGREYRTVEIDPERAPLVRWVFEQYAAGERTVVDLLAEVTARGLTSVPTPKRPSGPVGRATFFDLLRNRTTSVWFPPNRGGLPYAASRSGAAVFS